MKLDFSTQRFDLTAELMARTPLEEGFAIVDMQVHPDCRQQRILRDNAFKGQSTVYRSLGKVNEKECFVYEMGDA